MHSAFPTSFPIIGSNSRKIAASLSALSEDKVRVRVFGPGALLPPFRYVNAVSSGTVEIAWGTPASLGDRSATAWLLSGAPFSLPPQQHFDWLKSPEGRRLYDLFHKRFGIKSIPCTLIGADGVGWFRSALMQGQDLKGLRIRTGGLAATVLDTLGANVLKVRGADIYLGLFGGALDAAELSAPYIDCRLGFHQVSRTYYYPSPLQPTTLVDLVLNRETWNQFGPKIQESIETACNRLAHSSIKQDSALRKQALAQISEAGIDIRELPRHLVSQMRSAWNSIRTKLREEDSEFAAIDESMTRFRNGQPPDINSSDN